MQEKLKYYLLTVSLMSAPLMGGGSGISLIDAKNALQANFEPPSPIVEERDPQLLALIEDIAMCESSNREDVKIVDTNGYYSYGIMQFQLRTFEHALIDLGYGTSTYDDYRAQMMDGDRAKQIAYEWIDKDFNNVHHWSCYKKVV